MAKLQYLLLLLSLSSDVLGQNTSASVISSSASLAASSASAAASSASSLASEGSSSAASSLSSVASSESSVASSLSSIASSLSSIAPTTSSSSSSSSSSTITTSTPSSSSSSATATETSSPAASTASSTSPSSSSSSTISTSDSSSTPSSSTVFTTSSTSVSFSTSTVASTDVIPTTSDGVVGYTTLTTYVVSSNPATTYISPYTETSLAAANPTTQGDASNSGGGGPLSTGAKIGIGVGVGLAVLAAAIFGGWYSWYMRRRRRRSISNSDRYPPSSLPSMTGMMGGAAYAEKSDTPSEMHSPGLGDRPSPPMRSPDRLIPVGGGVRSWNSVSNSNVPNSNHSVSDYSERGGQPPPDASDGQQGSYVPPGGAIHEMPENQREHQQPQPQAQESPQNRFAHSRTVSGESQPSELGEGTLPPNHQRTLSGGSQQYQQPSMDADGYWQSTQNPQELQGSPTYGMQQSTSRGSEGYRGVDPEVPLHQRMQTERVPIRPGHLQKQPPAPNLPPSHNF